MEKSFRVDVLRKPSPVPIHVIGRGGERAGKKRTIVSVPFITASVSRVRMELSKLHQLSSAVFQSSQSDIPFGGWEGAIKVDFLDLDAMMRLEVVHEG